MNLANVIRSGNRYQVTDLAVISCIIIFYCINSFPFLAIPTIDFIQDDQVHQELPHLHVPLRRQVQRHQSRWNLWLDPAQLVRNGRWTSLHSRSTEGCRNDGEENLHCGTYKVILYSHTPLSDALAMRRFVHVHIVMGVVSDNFPFLPGLDASRKILLQTYIVKIRVLVFVKNCRYTGVSMCAIFHSFKLHSFDFRQIFLF